MLLWCFLTNSVEEHDNIQIINSLIRLGCTIKIAGPLQGENFGRQAERGFSSCLVASGLVKKGNVVFMVRRRH